MPGRHQLRRRPVRPPLPDRHRLRQPVRLLRRPPQADRPRPQPDPPSRLAPPPRPAPHMAFPPPSSARWQPASARPAPSTISPKHRAACAARCWPRSTPKPRQPPCPARPPWTSGRVGSADQDRRRQPRGTRRCTGSPVRPGLGSALPGAAQAACWRARPRQPALAADLGHLGAIAAAAAIRAGIAASVAVPVRDGAVHLPTIGRLVIGWQSRHRKARLSLPRPRYRAGDCHRRGGRRDGHECERLTAGGGCPVLTCWPTCQQTWT